MRLENAVPDWITSQEEKSSCKFGALQEIKVVRAEDYSHTGIGNKRTTLRKSSVVYMLNVSAAWWAARGTGTGVLLVFLAGLSKDCGN